jgi:hypothetical protein
VKVATSGVSAIVAGDYHAVVLLNPVTPTVPPPSGSIHFELTTQSSAYSGCTLQFGVRAVDSASQPVAGYNGTVHFTSSDPLAILPGDAALTAGTGSFAATFYTTGNQFLRAGDTANSTVSGTSSPISVAVNEAAPHRQPRKSQFPTQSQLPA